MEDFPGETSGIDSMKALIDELKKPQYQGLDDQAAADLVNVLTVQVRRMLRISEVLKFAIDEAFYGKIKVDIADPEISKEQRADLIDIEGWIDNRGGKTEFADLGSPTAARMIGNLLKYRYCTPEQLQKLGNMALVTVRWVDHNGLGEVGRGLVCNARRAIERGE